MPLLALWRAGGAGGRSVRLASALLGALVVSAGAACVQELLSPTQLPCRSDANCPPGEACCRGACYTDCAIVSCSTDADCPTKAFMCESSTCQRVVPSECERDADCAPSQVCERGQCGCRPDERACDTSCVPATGCCTVADCTKRGDSCHDFECRCAGGPACLPGALCTDVGPTPCVCSGRMCPSACVNGSACCEASDCGAGQACNDGSCE